MERGVSIIICCFNSGDRLPETIRHIADQKVRNDLLWEVLIVDNASTDNTQAIAQKLLDALFASGINGKLISEKEAGLSHARKAGIDAASFHYALFCDDDNWLSDNYVQDAFDLMEGDATFGACGGKGIAHFEVAEPGWFNNFKRSFAVGSALKNSGVITDTMSFLTGAGMMLRLEAWGEILAAGFASLLSDRKGKELSSGGDLEICAMLRLSGYRLYFADQISYKHFIPRERLTEAYLKRLLIGIAKANVTLTAYHYLLNGMETNKHLIWLRILVKLTPKLYISQKSRNQSFEKRMEFLSLSSYYRELISQNFQFDKSLKKINSVRFALRQQRTESNKTT